MKVFFVVVKEKPHFNRDDVREPYTDSFLKNAAGKVRKSTKGRFSKGETTKLYTTHMKMVLFLEMLLRFLLLQVARVKRTR